VSQVEFLGERETAAVRRDGILAPFGCRRATVAAREPHGAYVVLRCSDPAGTAPQAGQFYMLRAVSRWGAGEGERPFLPRAFSVMRAGTGSRGALELEFLLEDVGPGSKRLCELAPGDELLILGPLGHGFQPPRSGRRPLLVGGGVGIAPLAIWQDQLEVGTEVLLGFRDQAHAAGAALLQGPRIATDDGSVGHGGVVTELLTDVLKDDPQVEVYACGPPAMLKAVSTLSAAYGTPAQLALESGMACGFGACFGCAVPTTDGYLRLCLDGPVLGGEHLTADTFTGIPH
jgi:dihydroorotate dehydrogenase electron transfer subunit